MRPFPEKGFYKHLKGRKGVAVIDQNISMGKGGVLYAELTSALYGKPDAPPILASFTGGLGGRDIPAQEFYEIARILHEASEKGVSPPPRLLYTENEMRQVKTLQAVAHVERSKLGGT